MGLSDLVANVQLNGSGLRMRAYTSYAPAIAYSDCDCSDCGSDNCDCSQDGDCNCTDCNEGSDCSDS